MPKTNIIDNIVQTRQLVTKTYLSSMQCIPRPPPKQVPRKRRARTPWTVPKSIFASYKPDTEGLLGKCFENDWGRCKIPKIVKDTEELRKIKQVLRAGYKTVRETYKYYAAFDPTNDGVPCIGTNVYTDMMNQSGVIDAQFVKLSDVDIESVASNAGKGKVSNPRNPERSLVRYQMIEMLVRLALRKYQKSTHDYDQKRIGGVCKSASEAVALMMKDNFVKTFGGLDSHKWRMDKFWNEECDTVLKRYLPIIKELFRKYSGRYTAPGKPKYLSDQKCFPIDTSAWRSSSR